MLHLFPDYLPLPRKKEIENSLTLLQQGKLSEPYQKFYAHTHFNDDWLQGDLITSIRQPFYSKETNKFVTKYGSAIIISNTCDISVDNHRNAESKKECLMAPVFSVKEWLEQLGVKELKVRNDLIKRLRNQINSNYFYLPPLAKDLHDNELGYLVRFDFIFQFPVDQLNSKEFIENRETIRLASLSLLGFYLFLSKLSFHLCRLPEDNHRLD